jgi:5-methylcytosine-specific restriction endonuclease McrA
MGSRGVSYFQARAKSGRGKSGLIWVTICMNDPCPYCGEYGSDTVEHVTPRSKWWTLSTGQSINHWTNLVACHYRCNIDKGSQGLIQYLQRKPDYV